MERNILKKRFDAVRFGYSKYETGRKYVKNLQKIMDELTKPIHPL